MATCYEIRTNLTASATIIPMSYKRADKEFKEQLAKRTDEIRKAQLTERLSQIIAALNRSQLPTIPHD